MTDREEAVDVVLVGGGIMSATLAALLTTLEPTWRILLVERRDALAQESSNAWNNAGTGHAALCELNYTPERPDGTVDITKAIRINEQFELSRELWHYLATQGRLPGGTGFVTTTPHMTFVRGAQNVQYLRRRHQALVTHPLFAELEFSDDPDQIATWAPLLLTDRDPAEPVAATRAASGTDVDFGALTRALVEDATRHGTQVLLEHEVTRLRRHRDGWRLRVTDRRWNGGRPRTVHARFVFIGAGGGALPLLQKSRIPEIKGYAGFPISGQFLRTTHPALVAAHQAKVYGKADIGAPPMSVPHLDTRTVDGQDALLFGPYAGWSMKFLKHGSWTDLIRTVRPANLVPMLAVGLRNLDLLTYLISEVTATPTRRLRALRAFMPTAHPRDWELVTAGQRVQVIKRDPTHGGVLEFGTELITAADGTIAGLLGASPGASTAAAAMVELLERCFPDRAQTWAPQLREMMPSLGGGQWDESFELDHLVDEQVTSDR
ncbi:malate dehydrogenase (quinone) [Cellulomonas soli]|uniref:malate dehydrogenase (quinone) n=1 Tax=Cellulomonas soli TaxID=931535 RepID=UPI003F86B97F